MALIEIDRSKMSKEDREFEDLCRQMNTKQVRDAWKLVRDGMKCSNGKLKGSEGVFEGNFNNGVNTITIHDSPNDPGQRMINEGFNRIFQSVLPINQVKVV